jgi:hypothetical protein
MAILLGEGVVFEGLEGRELVRAVEKAFMDAPTTYELLQAGRKYRHVQDKVKEYNLGNYYHLKEMYKYCQRRKPDYKGEDKL